MSQPGKGTKDNRGDAERGPLGAASSHESNAVALLCLNIGEHFFIHPLNEKENFDIFSQRLRGYFNFLVPRGPRRAAGIDGGTQGRGALVQRIGPQTRVCWPGFPGFALHSAHPRVTVPGTD